MIDSDLYKIKNEEWTLEHARLKSVIESHENANKSYMDKGLHILELAQNLYSQYLCQNDCHFASLRRQAHMFRKLNNSLCQKVKLVKIVSSNFVLNGRKASYEYKKPFDILAKGLSYLKSVNKNPSELQKDFIWLSLIDMFRNYLLENVA